MNDNIQADDQPQSEQDGPSGALVHQWVVAGITSAAARFIPIPFVDDIVKVRSRQFVVSRTLAAHDRSYGSSKLSVLYSDGEGCAYGCLMFGLLLPVRLLLFPFRKLVKILTSVHGVPVDLLKTIVIGRTLDRCLRRGMLADGDGPDDIALRTEESDRIRAAFDSAFHGIDWLAVRSALGDALSHVSGWRRAAARLARRAFRRSESSIDELPSDVRVNESAKNVEAILRRPETLQLLERFDERFDAALAALNTPKAPIE